MLFKTPIESVRWPEPGESLRFRPADSWPLWLRVHNAALGSLPCVGRYCLLCQDQSRSPHTKWEGYLCGFDLTGVPVPLVLRLTPRVHHRCLAKLPPGTDLRRGQLLVQRSQDPGVPQLAAVYVGELQAAGDQVEPVNGAFPYLLRHWKFPGAEPEYRQSVYRLWGRQAPADAAPFLRPDREPVFPPEEAP